MPVTFFESHSCLTGATTAELWCHLSNINIIFNRQWIFWWPKNCKLECSPRTWLLSNLRVTPTPGLPCNKKRNRGICDAYIHYKGNESCFSPHICHTKPSRVKTLVEASLKNLALYQGQLTNPLVSVAETNSSSHQSNSGSGTRETEAVQCTCLLELPEPKVSRQFVPSRYEKKRYFSDCASADSITILAHH